MGIGVKGFGGTSGGIEGAKLLPPAAVEAAGIFQTAGVSAVTFDGSTYLLRTGDFDGVVNSATGMASFWVRFNGNDGVRSVFVGNNNRANIEKDAQNKMMAQFQSTGSSTYFALSTSTYTAGPTWYHMLMSWDMNFSSNNKILHLYVNDVDDFASASDFNAAFDINYNVSSTHGIGARLNGANIIDGDLAEFWWADGQFLDFSDVNNRRKFIDASGKPVDLGANGETPTGQSPAIFFSGNAANFATNLGTGGGVAVTGGSLTNASTSPSDD